MMAHTPPNMEDNAGVVDLSDPANILMRGIILGLYISTYLLVYTCVCCVYSETSDN